MKKQDIRHAQKKFLEQCKTQYQENAKKRKTINILGISCSTVNIDDEKPRTPCSEGILQQTMEYAQTTDKNIETKIVKLRELKFEHCEANYSMKSEYCTRPCRISQRKKEDELVGVYNLLVDRADAILVTTPIRRGAPASLYFKFIERLNCIENQKEVYGVDLLNNQHAGYIILGAQDGVQASLGQMMSFRTQLGCQHSKHPYVGYTSGNYTNDEMNKTTQRIKKEYEKIESQYKEMIDNMIKSIKQIKNR